MSLHAPGRKKFWLTLVIVFAVVPACKDEARPAAPAPAVQPPPPAAPPPSEPAAPTPAAAPAPSALRTALLAIADHEGFRALVADDFRLVENQGKGPAKITKLPRERVDAKIFDRKIKPRLPREPDPAGGEGEDFRCDDTQRSCVFGDETGRTTSYLFTAATPSGADVPKLREIQVSPAAR
jgi:hypothetical protein